MRVSRVTQDPRHGLDQIIHDGGWSGRGSRSRLVDPTVTCADQDAPATIRGPGFQVVIFSALLSTFTVYAAVWLVALTSDGEERITIVCVPSCTDVVIDGEERTAMRLLVERHEPV